MNEWLVGLQTNVALNALTGKGTAFAQADPLIDNGMTVERCCQLTLAGAASHLPELWIAPPKVKLMFYVGCYFQTWKFKAHAAVRSLYSKPKPKHE
jgi:hypothetical protein